MSRMIQTNMGEMPLQDYLDIRALECGFDRQLMRCVDEIDQRFCKLQNGDLTEERCRKDADKLFTKSQNPQEWELAKAFLCDKYGKEIADFVIKEMD